MWWKLRCFCGSSFAHWFAGLFSLCLSVSSVCSDHFPSWTDEMKPPLSPPAPPHLCWTSRACLALPLLSACQHCNLKKKKFYPTITGICQVSWPQYYKKVLFSQDVVVHSRCMYFTFVLECFMLPRGSKKWDTEITTMTSMFLIMKQNVNQRNRVAQ